MSGYDSDPFVKLRKKIFGEDKKKAVDDSQEPTMKKGGSVHNVEHTKKHAAGHQHEQEKVAKHSAGHKSHHEHVKAMCGGGYMKGKK